MNLRKRAVISLRFPRPRFGIRAVSQPPSDEQADDLGRPPKPPAAPGGDRPSVFGGRPEVVGVMPPEEGMSVADRLRVVRVAAALMVISAVEGVQPQTRVLMRTLERLRIPTLIFVNKIDRDGAHCERALQSISEKLAPAIIPMGSTIGPGTRGALYAPYSAADADFTSRLVDLLADHDDAFLAAYVNYEKEVSYRRLRAASLRRRQRRRSRIRCSSVGDDGSGRGQADFRHHGVSANGRR